jgi:hypothetical protein
MDQAKIGTVPLCVKYAIIGAGIHGVEHRVPSRRDAEKSGKGSGEDILVVDKTAIAAGASGIARPPTYL